MPTPYRRLRRRFYFQLARLLLGLLRRLPRDTGRRFCSGLAALALRIRGRDAESAARNIARAFPELGPAGIRERLASSTAALGRNFYDALTLDHWQADDYRDVQDDGVFTTISELRRDGKGVLLLTGHLGCWELLGGYLAHGLQGLTVVTGTIHNRPVDKLINDWRRRAGMETVPREGDLRPLLRALQEGKVVAVLMDQNTGVESLDVPFFGRKAPTAAGFARLALKYGIPALPVSIARSGEGHIVMHKAALQPAEYQGTDGEYGFLQDCNRNLEAFIRAHPDEWVWFHKRWRD
jgi:Kdo2-lipid IVA lauroyltransferase/acyltransferase